MKPISLKALTSPRWWSFFLGAGCSFMLFGLVTANLFLMLHANLDLFVEHGSMVLRDGAGLQLLQLLGLGYLGMVCWVVFKVCETAVVQGLFESGGK